jgi:hypothetical protein
VQGASLGVIAIKTGIPKTSLRRYLPPRPAASTASTGSGTGLKGYAAVVGVRVAVPR